MNHWLRLAFTSTLLPTFALLACDAGVEPTGGFGQGLGGNGAGGTSASGGTGEGGGQTTGTVMFTGGNGAGGEGEGGMIVNPCGTACGPEELCTGVNKGLDDDCDGDVDEGCACRDGQASSCFKGDPSYLEAVGCNPGTMHCTELGTWGPCDGGNHATDLCFSADPLGCHPLNIVPFGTSDLTEGPGNFNDDPAIDSETYTVTCPPGVNPCPVPNGTDYTPLQSGEYTVTYTKTVDGVPEECTFPLYVGARGLRVELSWNFDVDVDLDLHMKQPMSTLPWVTSGAQQDCGFGNCNAFDFQFGGSSAPKWFPDGNMIPDPVNWYEDPDFDLNSCYFAPQGEGQDWIDGGMGCHNPRLDLDNVVCNPTITDPQLSGFCAPENINVDFPPADQWIRIGVHHWSHHGSPGAAYPNVKIFCDGALAADLGASGFYEPNAPITFGANEDNSQQWLVADVLFRESECVSECIVEPLYLAPDVAAKLPVILLPAAYGANNGPPYPPIPQ